MTVKKISVTINGFELPDEMVADLYQRLQHADDVQFAEALAVARKAGVIVVTKKDRDNPAYLDKRSRRSIGGIELNLRLRKVLK